MAEGSSDTIRMPLILPYPGVAVLVRMGARRSAAVMSPDKATRATASLPSSSAMARHARLVVAAVTGSQPVTAALVVERVPIGRRSAPSPPVLSRGS